MKKNHYQVVIIGAGVTGTALAYVLSMFTSIRDVLVLEKAERPGTVNSSAENNSQTLHTGDIETNYSLANALSVRDKAKLLEIYTDSKGDPNLSKHCNKMVLGIGDKEVEILKDRFDNFKIHYPGMQLLSGRDIATWEPAVMKNRNPASTVAALASTNGLMINYQMLSSHFITDAKACNQHMDVFFGAHVSHVSEGSDHVIISTSHGDITADAVMFASGAYSLFFAHMLGYGKCFTMLPVAGSFFEAKKALTGKVYRVQTEGIPFAAIHGDPDITDGKLTRFGPTTKPLPLMERHHYNTILDFFKTYRGNFLRGVLSLFRIVVKKRLIGYVAKNALFDTPFLGKWMFLKEARTVIPSISYGDLRLRKGAGGIRPQLVDTTTMELMMGDATIRGGRCIFNTTPSPGASVCLANGVVYAKELVEKLGHGHVFNESKFEEIFSK